MSHILETTTTIVPNLSLLSQALAEVSTRYEGEICSSYTDFSGKSYSTTTGLVLRVPRSTSRPRNQSHPRGIGLDLDEQGVLIFRGDDWGVEAFAAQIKREIIQAYVLLGVKLVFQQKHYEVTAQEEGNRLVIVGKRAAGQQRRRPRVVVQEVRDGKR